MLMHIVVSFLDPTPQLIEKVVVGSSMSNADGKLKTAAHSLVSVADEDEQHVLFHRQDRTYSELGILSYEATTDVAGVPGRAFSRGGGERESDPEWQFTGSKERPLVGIYPLSAVIPAPIRNVFERIYGLDPLATGTRTIRADLAHDYSHLEF